MHIPASTKKCGIQIILIRESSQVLFQVRTPFFILRIKLLSQSPPFFMIAQSLYSLRTLSSLEVFPVLLFVLRKTPSSILMPLFRSLIGNCLSSSLFMSDILWSHFNDLMVDGGTIRQMEMLSPTSREIRKAMSRRPTCLDIGAAQTEASFAKLDFKAKQCYYKREMFERLRMIIREV